MKEKKQKNKIMPVIKELFSNTNYPGFRYFIMALTMVAGAAGGVYFAVTIGNSVQIVADGGQFRFANVVLPIIIAAVIQLLSEYFKVLTVERCGAEIERQFTNLTFKRLIRSRQSWLENQKTGELINKAGESLWNASQLLTGSLPGTFETVMSMGVMIIYLIINNWMLAVLYFALFPLVIYMQDAFSKPISQTVTERLEASGKCNNIAVDALRNTSTVKAYGLEEVMRERYSTRGIFLQSKFRKFYWRKSVVCFIGQAVAVIPTLLVCLGAVYLVSRGVLELGSLLAFILVMLRLNNPLLNFSRIMADVRGNIAGAERTLELWNSPQEDRGRESYKPDMKTSTIDIRNINFSYDKENPVIKDMSILVNKGEHIAIVGESGCGKSTVLKLISGLYETDGGNLKVMGTDVSEWNLLALRNNISYVPQSNDLFPVTLYENITWGCDDHTMMDVERACKRAGILNHIQSLPDGFNTLAGERGIRLSGGQRQRIAIARAILRNTELILLDEATSSLDSVTEREVQTSLEILRNGKTSITVSHRLSSIRNADRIYVIEDGGICESGSHNELIAAEGSYCRLYMRQQEETDE